MTDQPLNRIDQDKILIFSLLLFLCFFIGGAGVIPAVFLIYGIFMMKKSGDFSYIETATKYFKIYMYVALIVGIYLIIYSYNEPITGYSMYHERYLIMVGSLIPIVAIILIDFLFIKPLEKHKEWVSNNRIFSNKCRTTEKYDHEGGSEKRGKEKPYSVADELVKWAKLKEDGLITEEEYNQARNMIFKESVYTNTGFSIVNKAMRDKLERIKNSFEGVPRIAKRLTKLAMIMAIVYIVLFGAVVVIDQVYKNYIRQNDEKALGQFDIEDTTWNERFSSYHNYEKLSV